MKKPLYFRDIISLYSTYNKIQRGLRKRCLDKTRLFRQNIKKNKIGRRIKKTINFFQSSKEYCFFTTAP